jgi:hypothetical protein
VVGVNCQHKAQAAGETFSRCLSCLSWRFTVGCRWWPQSFDLPWTPNEHGSGGEMYQLFGVSLPAARESLMAETRVLE